MSKSGKCWKSCKALQPGIKGSVPVVSLLLAKQQNNYQTDGFKVHFLLSLSC
jgi:hypothetical protein